MKRFGLTLLVQLHLLGTQEGGRSNPISSGYRPLCEFSGVPGSGPTVGLCEVALMDGETLAPGATGRAWLQFAPAVAGLVRSLAAASHEVLILEGNRIVGRAIVMERAGLDRNEPGLTDTPKQRRPQ
jgi:hypothetical protein